MFKLKLKNRHKHLLALIKENKFRLFLAMACMLVIAVASSATAFLVKPVLDDIFFNKDTAMLKIIPLVVILIYFLRGLGMYGQDYLMIDGIQGQGHYVGTFMSSQRCSAART